MLFKKLYNYLQLKRVVVVDENGRHNQANGKNIKQQQQRRHTNS